jgi:protein-S-isoprenylcysteine O-methyltransferase Ste14
VPMETDPQPDREAGPKRARPAAAIGLLLLAGWAIGPFIAAGRLWWPLALTYFALSIFAVVAQRLYMKRRHPELLVRRKRVGAGTKAWDRPLLALYFLSLPAIPIVAGLGVRFAWPQMPAILWPFGLLLFVTGLVVAGWAMASNPFFEGTARIQEELGHQVVEAGPYRYLRHPGYFGWILWSLGTPVLLLSLPALLPASLAAFVLVIRTSLEDAMLRRELNGYAEYATRTRSRLIPGLW